MPGPKSKIDRDEIAKLISQGLSKKEISQSLNLSYATIKKHSTGIRSLKANSWYVCRDCGKNGEEHFYITAKYHCRDCFNKKTYTASVVKIKNYMDTRGGAKCQRCGYDRYIGSLEFHHRNPSEKDPSWNRGWNMEKLKVELDKCDILCSNCHREVHAEMRLQDKVE